MESHVALKATYNNGGEGVRVGFAGTCSRDIIKLNVHDEPRSFCSMKDCGCARFFRQGMKGPPPDGPCYESELFVDWRFAAGWNHNGVRINTPRRLPSLNPDGGGVALVTTRFPGDSEGKRKVVGFFRIGRVENPPNKETWIIGDSRRGVRLLLDEARVFDFWDYYTNPSKGPPDWRQGLIRYLRDSQVRAFLQDFASISHDERARNVAKSLLGELSPSSSKERWTFPQVPTSPGRAVQRLSLERKYGRGGEGPQHRDLKEWVRRHPDFLGYEPTSKGEAEHRFLSGDLVDVLLSTPEGRFAAVEIETDDPWPGAHQALKYRVLKCAEEGFSLNSPKVDAVLVAWSIPADLRRFCKKYQVRVFEKKV